MRKTESKITGQINMCVSLKGNIYWWYWGKTFGLMKLDCFHYRLTHAHLVQGQILHVLNQLDPFSLNTTFIRHSMYEYICNYVRYVCSVFIRSLNHMKNTIFSLRRIQYMKLIIWIAGYLLTFYHCLMPFVVSISCSALSFIQSTSSNRPKQLRKKFETWNA